MQGTSYYVLGSQVMTSQVMEIGCEVVGSEGVDLSMEQYLGTEAAVQTDVEAVDESLQCNLVNTAMLDEVVRCQLQIGAVKESAMLLK